MSVLMMKRWSLEAGQPSSTIMMVADMFIHGDSCRNSTTQRQHCQHMTSSNVGQTGLTVDQSQPPSFYHECTRVGKYYEEVSCAMSAVKHQMHIAKLDPFMEYKIEGGIHMSLVWSLKGASTCV